MLEVSTAYTSLLVNQPRTTSSRQLSMKLGSDSSSSDDLITSRNPQKIGNGRGQFLGFRSVHDFKKQALETGSVTTTALNSEASALIPDGGLSPCVIRVLGVGGGGCNAVSSSV